MNNNIVPLPAPENQPVIKKAVEPIEPNWKAIRRQLYKLFAEGRLTDPFNREAAAIILGPGILGPVNQAVCDAGILYITGEKRRYLQRAYRAFQAFHRTYYGYELSMPETFSPEDLRMYRLAFFWERAKTAYFSPQKKNLRQNKKPG
jgi:hypothetical protein